MKSKHSSATDPAIESLLRGDHSNPHGLLGVHLENSEYVVRALLPNLSEAKLVTSDAALPMERVRDEGVFEAHLGSQPEGYQYEVLRKSGPVLLEDPYRFGPSIGEIDLHLIGEGSHKRIWEVFGAHLREHEGAHGVSFVVWAPNARGVRVVGDFNQWNGLAHPMRSMGGSGVWELFVPEAGPGDGYKFEIRTAQGLVVQKADPFGTYMEKPPKTASLIHESSYRWNDERWIAARESTDPLNKPISIYECHLGSWRRKPEEGNRSLSYRELCVELPQYLGDLGFTHVELLPVSEHPFDGSWGYQVSGYYAPTSRFGDPDDFRLLVDSLHNAGIGVIVDWVPAHFPKDEFALARFDGTSLYEHADPRRGEHPDWGTLIFNFGRNEVRNFLVSNARYWVEQFHIDGLRVDAVASMLYLDYSRQAGEWLPNRFGGRENLEAVEFLREMNVALYDEFPGIMTIAEESTAWPAVSRPTYVGGLGFGLKWNMGWMHDTLDYFSKQPVHRKFHHNQLTFGLLYAFHENFILPISHDEVVHGKGSLLNKMPGDRWQQMANLRALLAWMWAHPGKQLLFMGDEIAQEAEWNHDKSLDWHVLEWEQHAGVQRLVKDLNSTYRSQPSLWEIDFSPEGFRWIDANDNEQNVLSFLRFSRSGQPLACIANLSPLRRDGYRVGLPKAGGWHEVLNSDLAAYAGSGVTNETVEAEAVPWHGLEASTVLQLPPIATVWLTPT